MVDVRTTFRGPSSGVTRGKLPVGGGWGTMEVT